MTEPSLLQAAVDELYAAPLAEFVERRKALAAAARKAGDRGSATAIGALRKPSLSADTVNRLVRGAPAEVDALLKLGADLRRAEQALDAAELRSLGSRRRRLVGDLADLAFELTGQAAPSAAVRDEVTATLNAALADDEVAQRLSSGALVTQARWDGFGSTQLPELASSMPLMPPRRPEAKPGSRPATTRPVTRPGTAPTDQPASSRPAPQPDPATKPAAATKPTKATKAASAKEVSADDAAAKQAAADQERAAGRVAKQAAARESAAKRAAAEQQAAQRAAAQQAAEAAANAAAQAAEAQELVSSIDRRVSELNLQLAHQRRLLADAQRALRAAENERRVTALAATRAGARVD